MPSIVVNHNMNIRQCRIILRASFVEISIVNTNPDFPVFLGDRNNIIQPSWILCHFHQSGIYLLGNVFLNLQTQFRLDFLSFLLHRIEPRVNQQLMRYDVGTQPLHVTDFLNEHIPIFSKQMN